MPPDALAARPPRRLRLTPAWLCLPLALGVLVLALDHLLAGPGPIAGLAALLEPAATADTATGLVLHYAWWPRLAMALLAGGGLALAGVLMQQVLRNPLAAPTTLGVASGANLALMAVSLMAPSLLGLGREWVALAGGGLAMGLVFALAWRRGLAPMVVVLGGLVVNLYFGALSMVLLLFHQEALKGLLIWGRGRLTRTAGRTSPSWRRAWRSAPCSPGCCCARWRSSPSTRRVPRASASRSSTCASRASGSRSFSPAAW